VFTIAPALRRPRLHVDRLGREVEAVDVERAAVDLVPMVELVPRAVAEPARSVPPVKETSELFPIDPVTSSVPARTSVRPGYELVVASVSVPVPSFRSVPPVMPKAPEKV
jgi:hypothetical protein